jgi:hypothetical protein
MTGLTLMWKARGRIFDSPRPFHNRLENPSQARVFHSPLDNSQRCFELPTFPQSLLRLTVILSRRSGYGPTVTFGRRAKFHDPDPFHHRQYGLSAGLPESNLCPDGVQDIQDGFMNTVTSCTNNYGNALYEICNECNGSKGGGDGEWTANRINKIKLDQDLYHKPYVVGQGPENGCQYNLICGCNDVYLKHRIGAGGGSGVGYQHNWDLATHRDIIGQTRNRMETDPDPDSRPKPIIHDEFFLYWRPECTDFTDCDVHCFLDVIRKMTWANVTGGGHSAYYDFAWFRGGGATNRRDSQAPPSRLNVPAKGGNCHKPLDLTAPKPWLQPGQPGYKTALDELGYISGFFNFNGIPFAYMAPEPNTAVADGDLQLDACTDQDTTTPCHANFGRQHFFFDFRTQSPPRTHFVRYIMSSEEGADEEQCGMVHFADTQAVDTGLPQGTYQLKWYDPQEGKVVRGPSFCGFNGSCPPLDCSATPEAPACVGASYRCGSGEYAGPVGDARLGTASPVQLVNVDSQGKLQDLRTPWFTRDMVLLISTGSTSCLYRYQTGLGMGDPAIADLFPLPRHPDIPGPFTSGGFDPTDVLTTNDPQFKLVCYQVDASCKPLNELNKEGFNSLVVVKHENRKTVRLYF